MSWLDPLTSSELATVMEQMQAAVPGEWTVDEKYVHAFQLKANGTTFKVVREDPASARRRDTRPAWSVSVDDNWSSICEPDAVAEKLRVMIRSLKEHHHRKAALLGALLYPATPHPAPGSNP
jgi:hypothetical protein